MCMSVCARTRGCLSHSVALNPLWPAANTWKWACSSCCWRLEPSIVCSVSSERFTSRMGSPSRQGTKHQTPGARDQPRSIHALCIKCYTSPCCSGCWGSRVASNSPEGPFSSSHISLGFQEKLSFQNEMLSMCITLGKLKATSTRQEPPPTSPWRLVPVRLPLVGRALVMVLNFFLSYSLPLFTCS